MKQIFHRAALCGIALLAATTSIQPIDYLFVFKDGAIRHRESLADVQSLFLEKEKTSVALCDTANQVLYSSLLSEIDSISFQTEVPQADLLDIRFLDDGTAVDVSPMKMEVEKVGNSQFVYYSDTYKRNIVSFSAPWGGVAYSYYKINYESAPKFRNALADGHTMECIMMARYSSGIPNLETKWFSSHQDGGVGFLCSTHGDQYSNQITYLPNVSTNGTSHYCWVTSGIVPEPQVYYHVVGVWDKEKGTASIYVNGELKNTVDAPGSFVLPEPGNCWLCIGGDPEGSSSANAAWNGNVVLARVYDDPLDAEAVNLLWEQARIYQDHALPDLVTDVSILSGVHVKPNGVFLVFGEGFAEGDQLALTDESANETYMVDITPTADGCSFVVPQEMESGTFKFSLVRGERSQLIGSASITVGGEMKQGMKVIAHRGYWNFPGAAENGRLALQKACEEKFFGSECDVWITTDGHIMCNHDRTVNGITIESSSYATCKNLPLDNGEMMPELKEFLDIIAQYDYTKLIIEIKPHTDEKRGFACCDSVVSMVRERGLQDRVEYIAWNVSDCQRILMREPNAITAPLDDTYAPWGLYQNGIMGLDYTADGYRNHPDYVSDAHALGMKVNVWTIDDVETMVEMADMGIDYVTTNNPILARQVYAFYEANYDSKEEEKGWEKTDSAYADLLDIRFNADGTVEDLSPMKNKVEVISSDGQTVPVEYNEEYKAYAGCFENTWGGSAETYCKVDYSENRQFLAALADGHTIETVFCPTYEGTIQDCEAKWFSSHQSGGTGFLISKQSSSRKNEITFLPNISQTGGSTWRWVTSGVVPESGQYYHVVGVWDKEDQKAYIYVNGELKNTVKAKGSLLFPTDGSNWFGIGCDSSAEGGEASGNWRIVKARIYDKPLTPEEVEKLW